MRIYIVRHGETEANIKGVLQGWNDTKLSPLGIDLAEKTGEGLKDIKFDAVFSSPLDRAFNTAKIILNKNNNETPEIKIDDRIKEVNMGTWEGQCFKGPESTIPSDQMELFFSNPFKLGNFPHGENTEEVCKRTQDFLFDIAKNHNYKNVLITTHGFATRAILNFLYDNKEDFWQGRVPYNCAVNILDYKDGKFTFVAKDKVFYDKDQCINRYKM